MRKLVIAIDGPVGSGKSTAARRVAELLGYTYIDTGAMYRAVALKALRRKISADANDELVALASASRIDLRAQDGGQRVLLDGADVTAAIRTSEVSQAASKIAVIPGVRHVLVAEQRRAGANGGVVMEGRDIGSVVFPEAELKIFLTASDETRAQRRWREHQPLIRADGAVLVDSTAMEAEEVARLIAMLAHRLPGASRFTGRAS